MKKTLKGLMLTLILGLLAVIWAFGASAATVNDVALNTTYVGVATQGASDNPLGYHWFTLTNNGTEPITLGLASSPPGEIFEVVSDEIGGLHSLGQSNEATITIAAGTTRTVAVTAPGARSTPLHIWQDGVGGANKSLGSIGGYYVYFQYRDQKDGSLIAEEKMAVLSGDRNQSKVPPASFDYNGDVYVPVDPSARAVSYNANATTSDRTIVIPYKPREEGPYDIYVNCVNSANGALIGTPKKITVPGVTKVNGVKTYPTVQIIPEQALTVKDVNGKTVVYRLDLGQGALIHTYGDNTKTYTFKYVEDGALPNKAYLISIRYVDRATGLILMSRNETILIDQEQVTTTTVDLPNEITSSNGRRYVKCSDQPSQIQHLSNNTAQTVYKVEYELDTTVPTTDYDITIIYKDAVYNTEVRRDTVTIPYLQTVNFIADSRFDAIDPSTNQMTTYTLAVGEQRNINHEFNNMKRVYYLNYNSNGSNLVPTSVRIHYVENIANGKMYSVTANVPVNDVLVHIAPDKYDYNGKTYVISSGQSRMVTYSYGGLRTDFYIFYRVDSDEDPNAPNTTPGRTIIDDRESVMDQIGGDIDRAIEDNIVINPDDNMDIIDQFPDGLFDIPDDDTALGGEGITGKTNNFPWAWTIYGSVLLIAGVLVLIVIDRNRAKNRRR